MSIHFTLRDYMASETGWGSKEGRVIRDALEFRITSTPSLSLVTVSLAGVKRHDMTFARESVVALAAQRRGKVGFCLCDIAEADLLENWEAAAVALSQPLSYLDTSAQLAPLGPQPSMGLRPVLEYVLRVQTISTSETARHFSLSIQNASNKLKRLWEEGYLLRDEQAAPSGGCEFVYRRIAPESKKNYSTHVSVWNTSV
jgi:hypothetical protein